MNKFKRELIDLEAKGMATALDINWNKLKMKLTKHSQKNLDVINNFLLYIQRDNEKYLQMAKDYIEVDQVDGENSPQAILETALKSELILDNIEMKGKEDLFDVYAEDGLIYAVHEKEHSVSVWRLTKPQEEIEVEHKEEILSYCLANVTKEDEVSLGDIFLHGKYVEKLSDNFLKI